MAMSLIIKSAFVLSLAQLGHTSSLFTSSVLPTNISSTCITALTADVGCSRAAGALQAGTFYPKTELDKICTTDCASALSVFHQSVVDACQEDTWYGYDNVMEPVAMIPEIIRYHYNYTCLSDGTRLCNNVGAAYSVFLDPETAALDNGLPAGGDYGGYNISDPCDECLVDTLRFQAGSPYFNGPYLQESSIYESKTSSCGITNAPLTTTTLSIFSTTASPSATPSCAGTTYAVQTGDDCNSVSVNQGIGTAWLLTDNDLLAGCSEFPTSGDLCLVNTCEVYTVVQNDTCAAIAKTYGMSEAQLRAWNPSINAGCYNLDRMVGDQICVAAPGTPYTTPAPTTIQPSIPITAAPVPTNAADESNTYCGKWYEVSSGEYCNLVILKFSLSLDDFLFLNPAVNENCTNLYAEESYCVQAVGDINTYSGQAGYITYSLTSATSYPDTASTLPDVIWSSPTPTSTPIPLANDTRTECYQYVAGDDYQVTLDISNCELLADVMDVTLEDLQTWNPSLGNASDAACAFQSGLRYCAKYYEGVKADVDEDEWADVPARDGESANCTNFVFVDDTGYPDCTTILDSYDITIDQFFAWNPTVLADCSGVWADYRYCVATNDTTATPTTTSAAATVSSTASPTPPGPTQTGQPANCNKWYLVQSGDGCDTVETASGITHEQFLEWNPAVSSDCATGFWGDNAYCVGVSDSTSVSATTTTAAATSTASSASSTTLSPPGPTQEGQPSDCSAWYIAASGDGCTAVETAYGITHDQFIEWNPAVSSDCASGFWADEAYCVAVGGAPQPSQDGNAVANCNQYAATQDDDYCSLFAERAGIALTDLYAWNTVLGSDGSGCGSSFWASYYYCTGVSA